MRFIQEACQHTTREIGQTLVNTIELWRVITKLARPGVVGLPEQLATLSRLAPTSTQLERRDHAIIASRQDSSSPTPTLDSEDLLDDDLLESIAALSPSGISSLASKVMAPPIGGQGGQGGGRGGRGGRGDGGRG